MKNEFKATTHWRSQHRSKSHASAHAAQVPKSKILDHPLVPKTEAQLITAQEQLDALVIRLRRAGSFAFDSEFIGELTYIPKLCLLQVATNAEIALVDPLADLDLNGFWQLVCDPAIEKIVHAGQQDLEPVFRHTDSAPANVFDTQIAAGFAALPYPAALGKLVAEILGAKLGKALTLSNWDQRPLSAVQLAYAADDVRYLPALRAALRERLSENGHAAWASEESNNLCAPALYHFDAIIQSRKLRGSGNLPPRNLAVLRELLAWRNSAARQQDLPPRAFLRDEVLVDLARTPAASADKLAKVRGLPRNIEQRYSEQILAATQRAMCIPADTLVDERQEEPPLPQRFAADSLWATAQCLALGQGIDPALVASRQDVIELYRALHKGETADTRLLQGWRREAVGEKLLELWNGKGRFEIGWAGGRLRVE